MRLFHSLAGQWRIPRMFTVVLGAAPFAFPVCIGPFAVPHHGDHGSRAPHPRAVPLRASDGTVSSTWTICRGPHACAHRVSWQEWHGHGPPLAVMQTIMVGGRPDQLAAVHRIQAGPSTEILHLELVPAGGLHGR